MAPLVSVVIPIYNREHTISEAISSVLLQSIPNCEIIVVDDGSVDGGRQRVMSLDDTRIRYVYQPNSGANSARNRGIDLARGQYVALLDSDDRFLPGHLERSLAVLSKAPDVIVFARVVVDRGSGVKFLKPPRAPRHDEKICEYVMSDRGFIQTSTLVLATSTARRVRYLDWLKCGQDTDFAVRLSDAGFSFVMLEKPGAIWRDVADGTRISAASHPEHLLSWLDYVRPFVTDKALIGYRGWHIARALALGHQRLRGLRYFAAALVKRCYSPELAARILLQILLAGGAYRATANLLHRPKLSVANQSAPGENLRK
ncbi:glycosyltransferase family 2 protein [Rhizobium sullae]|uniref:Glycosyltransferase involved in cell wall biosynthesis n=1 Tax=Rhizobium sullae TaxID=50338 RepID=A0A4R3PRY3_RHISU|nr:glycosyltransferase family 2 protein [Rhizobium sullae]TCU06825.1 glycosyltransferase involved in cell wall biosynthesis [Rhizobium sullae]